MLLAISTMMLATGCDPLEPPDSPAPRRGDETSWVTVFDPARAWTGYTLAFYAHRIPMLLDMNGRIIHEWPEARVKSRVRLLEDGSILAIALGRGVVEYDWDGDKVWQYEAEHGFAHHDVIRLANGNTVTLIRPDEGRYDEILEIDRQGGIAWRWHSGDHLRPFVLPSERHKNDVTHLNSIQELPANPWFAAGDERFRPGNFLVSAREMNLVFIIDRASGELTWVYRADLDKQHEPLMIGPDSPRAGRILIFNNRFRSFYRDRQSEILEIDPTSDTLVWRYRSADFYSPTSGVEQPLPNGNVLITSSRGGRTFEITRGGRVVWEWAPPFDTTRSARYRHDHAPQLAAMGTPGLVAVQPQAGYRYVDTDVYRFARRGLRRDTRIDERKISVLKNSNDCRNLMLPLGAQASLTYGLDARRLRGQGRDTHAARFRLEVRRPDSEARVIAFEDTVDLSAESWRTRTVDLGAFALRNIDLCVATEEVPTTGKGPNEGFAFWQQPVIESARDRAGRVREDDLDHGELTHEELEARKKHLEALGYID